MLVDFWTYTCINCIRTLPHLTAWDKAYRDAGLTIVGVHSPEFSFEHKASNVEAAIKQNGIKYPVAQDNELATWNAWGNQYWPAEYLIDAKGDVRHVNFGEGDTEGTEAAIRALLKEAGATNLPGDAKPSKTFDPAQDETPETYLGLERTERIVPETPKPGAGSYTAVSDVPVNSFSYGGGWTFTQESATAGVGATLTGHVAGKDVYLVLAPSKRRGEQGRRDRRRQAREDPGHHLAEALPPDVAPDRRRPHRQAQLRARRLGLRVHLRLIRKDQSAGTDGSHGRRRGVVFARRSKA